MTDLSPPADRTLDELRIALAPRIPAHAAFDGWGEAALAMAAAELDEPADRARLAFPGGAVDMIDGWFEAIDLQMATAYPPDRIAAMKVRDRVRDLVLFRLEAVTPHKEALRRALAVLARPQHAARAARLGWRTADRIWRVAGDTATDFNHYTKRTTLLGVYGSTMLAFQNDDSAGHADTRAFLDRRLADVMRIEKAKATWRGSRARVPSLTRFLSRLRYPAV